MTGKSIDYYPKTDVKLYLAELIVILAVASLVFATAIYVIEATKERCFKPKNQVQVLPLAIIGQEINEDRPPISPPLLPNLFVPQQINVNNVARNDEIVTSAFQILFIFLCCTIVLPITYIFLESRGQSSMENHVLFLLDSSSFSFVSIVVPVLMYCRKPEAWRHVKSELSAMRGN